MWKRRLLHLPRILQQYQTSVSSTSYLGAPTTLYPSSRGSLVRKCRLRSFSSRRTPTKSDGGPFGLIYKPPTYPIDNKTIADSIRCSLSGYKQEDFEYYTRDTGMSLIFLGTSAGVPTKSRSTTSTLLRIEGSGYLFDAGEGVQRQMAFTRAKPSHIEHIFITHLHGDHIFGLPGFLLGLQQSVMLTQQEGSKPKKRNEKEKQVVKIYGPPGLYNYIAANIVLSCTAFHSIHIEVYELAGGRVRRSHGSGNVPNPFEKNYPEFNFGFLTRKIITPTKGVWNIHDFPQRLSREEAMASGRRKGQSQRRPVRIQAAEVDHLSGIATFGFVVEEDEPAGNIDADKAKALGVSPAGKKYELLKFGFTVQTDDGSMEVQPHQVLKPRTKKARKVAIVGDNRGWTPQMTQIAQNADVLVHEATLTEEAWERGHSTAEMAGRVSGKSNAQLLVLNHISSKSDFVDENGNSHQLQLIENARQGSKHKSDVLVAYDFLEILVPRLGFKEPDNPIESELGGHNDAPDTASAAKRSSEDALVDTNETVMKLFGKTDSK